MTKQNSRIEWFAAITFGILIMAWLIVVTVLNQPATVYKTYPDGQCLKVEPASAGSCSNLPARYETVPVAPLEMRP